MKRSSPHFAAFVVAGVGLVVAAVASAQRPPEKPPEGGAFGGMPGVTQGVTELVAVTEAKDAVVAYSAYTGRWHKQPIPAGIDRVSYTVGNGIVAFRTKNTLYGFSSEKGSWDSIDVGENALGPPAVGFNMAHFKTESKIYVFSRMAGNWSMIDLSKP
jgi:hypothetical protein